MKKLALFASVVMLGVLTAGAGTLGVAGFSDGAGSTNSQLFPANGQFAASFIQLKNNTGSTQTYSVLYYANDGTNRTPAANSFTIPAFAARGWRPVATDANEGVGSTIPNATGTAGAGSAVILFTESPAPSGAIRVFVGGLNGANSSYSWTLVQ